MSPVERLLAELPDARKVGDAWSAKCPAHEDRRASLSIGEGDDGRALVHCHAGCDPAGICAAVRLSLAELMPPRGPEAGWESAPAEAVYRRMDSQSQGGSDGSITTCALEN